MWIYQGVHFIWYLLPNLQIIDKLPQYLILIKFDPVRSNERENLGNCVLEINKLDLQDNC